MTSKTRTRGRPATDRIGHVYGPWRVVALAEPAPSGGVRWVCVCTTCGTTHPKPIEGGTLAGENVTPCKTCSYRTRIAGVQGQRFGKLVAVEPLESCPATSRHTVWRCVCDCGRECERPESSLRKRSSCGCDRSEIRRRACPPEDLRGQRFGKLTAVRLVRRGGAGGHARWSWQCDCGKRCTAFASAVKAERKLSCGECG